MRLILSYTSAAAGPKRVKVMGGVVPMFNAEGGKWFEYDGEMLIGGEGKLA